MKRFKIGDKVKVLRRWENNYDSTDPIFAESIVETIGKVGVIKKICRNSNYFVWFPRPINDCWYYPEYVLELVQDQQVQPTPYFSGAQVGDKVVCLLSGKGTIVGINPRDIYRIKVHFESGYKDSYDVDGKFGSSFGQILFYAGTTINITPAPEPKREYVPQVGDVCEYYNNLFVVSGVFDSSGAYKIFDDGSCGQLKEEERKSAKLLAHYDTWQ